MNVLLVEDEKESRNLFAELLKHRGHEVCACGTALEALKEFQKRDFPLVVTDWMMPGMDGLQLTRRIRGIQEGDTSVILVITARRQAGDLQTVLDAGADDYITKPIDLNSLNIRLEIAERRVDNLLQRRRAESRVDEMMEELQKSRNDMLAILDLQQVGTAMIERAGDLSFISQATERLLGIERRMARGSQWRTVFPFSDEDCDQLAQLFSKSTESRSKLHISTRVKGQAVQVELEVRDDPRTPDRKIIFLYDVTDVRQLQEMLRDRHRMGDIIGKSKPMREVFHLIEELAKVDTTVLILGDTGTGKELTARAIHQASHRREKPFVAVNCAGLTESLLGSQLFGHRRGAFTGAISDQQGVFEAANGGTIFLDEIGDIPPTVQINLLRVLQEREVTRIGDTRPRKIDVRILTATNADLREKVANSTFRHDLYYRIRVATLQLPLLRERRDDIPLLVQSFLIKFRASLGKMVRGIANEAMRALMDYAWPGNVRELQSAIEFAVIRSKGETIQLSDLLPEIVSGVAFAPGFASAAHEEMNEPERIKAALQRARGNRTRAARLLGMSRATFYRRLTEYQIQPD